MLIDCQTGDYAAVKQLFVYGSFLEGFFNYKKALEGNIISRTQARVRGLLFHQNLKGYPAMVEGEGWVYGEFLELRDFDALVPVCDKIEEYYGSGSALNVYERKITEAELENGQKRPAWVYWYNRSDLGSVENPAVPVLSGNWREFMQNRNDPAERAT